MNRAIHASRSLYNLIEDLDLEKGSLWELKMAMEADDLPRMLHWSAVLNRQISQINEDIATHVSYYLGE